MAGISGEFFKQFALTIAALTIISAFNSLTLSPALWAILFKGHGHAPADGANVDGGRRRTCLRPRREGSSTALGNGRNLLRWWLMRFSLP